jgi:adenosylcobinamide-GDP ribazoletransferase
VLPARADAVAPPVGVVRRAWGGLVGAITFLTIVPVRGVGFGEFQFADTIPWFPIVGGAIGALAGGFRVGLQPVLGRGPSTVIAMIAMVASTGALHQDALADFADGLGVRGDRERRLAVMRDSATGAFGALALIGWALLLYTALEPLSARHALLTLIAAGAAGRLAAPVHGLVAAPARSDGLGSGFRVGRSSVLVATVCTIVIVVAAVGPERGAITLAVCAAVALLSARAARRALGGSTGDTIGTAVALTEVAACVALSALWR